MVTGEAYIQCVLVFYFRLLHVVSMGSTTGNYYIASLLNFESNCTGNTTKNLFICLPIIDHVMVLKGIHPN